MDVGRMFLFYIAASPLIREMLTVTPSRRADIEKICSHWWVNEGHADSCLDIAEELANQTPVRLDLLLSLAPPPPAVGSDKILLTDEQVKVFGTEYCESASSSLGVSYKINCTEIVKFIVYCDNFMNVCFYFSENSDSIHITLVISTVHSHNFPYKTLEKAVFLTSYCFCHEICNNFNYVCHYITL
jgi:hypothetical protein